MLERKSILYVIAVVGSIFWGLCFLMTKVALTGLDTIQVLAGRWTIAMLLFLGLVAAGVIKVRYRGKPIWMVAAVAFIQPCIYSICETCGVDLTTASESSIMCAMVPIMVAVLSLAALKNRIRPGVAAGILLSFAGIVITVVFCGNFSMGGKLGGYLFLGGMILTGAVFTLGSSRISRWFSPMEITFAQAVLGGIWFNLLVLIRGQGFSWYSVCFTMPEVGLAVLFSGIAGSFLCYVAFHLVVSKIPAPQASMLQVNLVSLTGVISGILFLGDECGWYTFAGLGLVLTGVILANRTPADPQLAAAPLAAECSAGGELTP